MLKFFLRIIFGALFLYTTFFLLFSLRTMTQFPINLINVFFIIISFLIFFGSARFFYFFSIAGFLIMDLYSQYPFGVYLVAGFFSVMLAYLFKNWLIAGFNQFSILILYFVVSIFWNIISYLIIFWSGIEISFVETAKLMLYDILINCSILLVFVYMIKLVFWSRLSVYVYKEKNK